jgi:hypothetical protein
MRDFSDGSSSYVGLIFTSRFRGVIFDQGVGVGDTILEMTPDTLKVVGVNDLFVVVSVDE